MAVVAKRFHAECGGWTFKVDMAAGGIAIRPDTCEGATLLFDTTGPQGGDAGRGGMATLRLEVTTSSYQFNQNVSDYWASSTTVRAYGDWELTMLAAGLAVLGECLVRVGAAAPVNLMPQSAIDDLMPRPGSKDRIEEMFRALEESSIEDPPR